jgi:hypothetical protein
MRFRPGCLAFWGAAEIMKLMVVPVLAVLGGLLVSGCDVRPSPDLRPPSSATAPATVTVTASASPPAASQTASSSPAPTGPAAVRPGHATPEEAVAGVFQSQRAGKLAQSCTYLEPAVQANCGQAAAGAKSTPAVSGQVTIVGAVISGRYALVEVTGRSCVAGSGCVRNSSPGTNMPSPSRPFMTVYNRQLSTAGATLSPVPCVRVNNRWYVNETP